MRMILITLFYSTQEVSEELEDYSELNDLDWGMNSNCLNIYSLLWL
jgi:hypothetical protein